MGDWGGGYWTGCLQEGQTQAWKDGRKPDGSTLVWLLLAVLLVWDSLIAPALTVRSFLNADWLLPGIELHFLLLTTKQQVYQSAWSQERQAHWSCDKLTHYQQACWTYKCSASNFNTVARFSSQDHIVHRCRLTEFSHSSCKWQMHSTSTGLTVSVWQTSYQCQTYCKQVSEANHLGFFINTYKKEKGMISRLWFRSCIDIAISQQNCKKAPLAQWRIYNRLKCSPTTEQACFYSFDTLKGA